MRSEGLELHTRIIFTKEWSWGDIEEAPGRFQEKQWNWNIDYIMNTYQLVQLFIIFVCELAYGS